MYSSRVVSELMEDGFNPDKALGISVVVPIGPGEGIGQLDCVFDSIEKQEYRGPVEILAVCNGTPNSVYDAVKKRASITAIRSEMPLGYSGARNRGIEIAKYKTVVCVDADTVVDDKNMFERVEGSVNSGYVGGMTNIKPDMETCGESAFYDWTSMAGRYLTPLMNMPVIGKYIPTIGNGQFIYFKNGLGFKFDENLAMQEDVDFVKKMRTRGKVGFIDSSHVVTSGRMFRKDGPIKSWIKRAKGWLDYTSDRIENLAMAPQPVMA